MPSEYTKQSLGFLFGGNIASINYNFQTSSEPSTSTLTIVSEDNKFIDPSFDQEISIPPFGIPMKVLEFTKREDSKKKVLQVELVEKSSDILDKELVLIYGEHTDLDYNLNNDSYLITKGLFVPKTYYPNNSVFNSYFQFPNLRRNFVKNYGNGVNVIGTVRATYVRNFPARLTGTEFKSPEKTEWITFNAGSIDETLSEYNNEFVYGGNESGDLQIKFGFTLKNLYDLIVSKGLSFDGSSYNFMQDQSFFFQESGTIRNVLSSCLSKLGRSFYIDPITQRIIIISNKDISQINTYLLNKYSNFQNTIAATQLSLKKSIKDVEANHFVVKGDLESLSGKTPNNNLGSRRARKQKFYKLKEDFLSRALNSADIELMRVMAPIIFNIDDQETLDLLIYGLFRLNEKYSDGNLYGSEQCSFGEFEQRNENSPPSWQKAWINLDKDSDYKLNGFFNYKNAVGANFQFSGDGGSPDPLISPSEVSYYNRVKDFMNLWGGTYFSIGMSEKDISERNYLSHSKFIGGELNTFNFVVAKGSDFIAQVDGLKFLYNLLRWANEISDQNIKIDYTVSEIAEFATQKAIGTGDYYVIAKRNLFQGTGLNSNDVQSSIKSNLISFRDISDEKSYLMITEDAASAVNTIARDSKKAFKTENRKVKDELIVKFTKTQEDSPSGLNDEASDFGGGEETPSFLFLRNIQSRIRNFSKRSLSVLRNPISETKIFLQNINEINPQFEGPFISTSINYYRPPEISDFDIKNGVSSVSISISNQGIQTDISYSSRKFAKVDEALINEYLGSTYTSMRKRFNDPAFLKNRKAK